MAVVADRTLAPPPRTPAHCRAGAVLVGSCLKPLAPPPFLTHKELL